MKKIICDLCNKEVSKEEHSPLSLPKIDNVGFVTLETKDFHTRCRKAVYEGIESVLESLKALVTERLEEKK